MKLVRGDSFTFSLIWKDANGAPVDVSGASVRVYVRDAMGSLALSASTSDGRVSLDGVNGRIDVLVPYSAPTALTHGQNASGWGAGGAGATTYGTGNPATSGAGAPSFVLLEFVECR